MRFRQLAALGVGVLAASAVAGFPASAADSTIAASGTQWIPSTANITVGESVTWTNSGGTHNVCVQKPGTTGDSCDEFTNGAPSSTWMSVSHQFTVAGTYNFFCANHRSLGMTGSITVGPSSGGGTPGNTQTTETTTLQTQTQTQTQIQTPSTSTDTTAPTFTGKIKRRAGRTSLILTFSSSEEATLGATVFRRPPSRHSFTRISQSSIHVKQGKNVVTLLRKFGKARRGAYRVQLQLVDAAGNKSTAKTLSFKLA